MMRFSISVVAKSCTSHSNYSSIRCIYIRRYTVISCVLQVRIGVLRRKILDTLREWKGSHGTECLLVNGARQVGKSFAIEAFGRAKYESYK